MARDGGTVAGHHHVGAIALEDGCMGQRFEVTIYKDGLTLPRVARARNCGGVVSRSRLHTLQLSTSDPVFEQIAVIGGGVRFGFDGHYRHEIYQIVCSML